MVKDNLDPFLVACMISKSDIQQDLMSCLKCDLVEVSSVKNSFSGESFGFYDYLLFEVICNSSAMT